MRRSHYLLLLAPILLIFCSAWIEDCRFSILGPGGPTAPPSPYWDVTHYAFNDFHYDLYSETFSNNVTVTGTVTNATGVHALDLNSPHTQGFEECLTLFTNDTFTRWDKYGQPAPYGQQATQYTLYAGSTYKHDWDCYLSHVLSTYGWGHFENAANPALNTPDIFGAAIGSEWHCTTLVNNPNWPDNILCEGALP